MNSNRKQTLRHKKSKKISMKKFGGKFHVDKNSATVTTTAPAKKRSKRKIDRENRRAAYENFEESTKSSDRASDAKDSPPFTEFEDPATTVIEEKSPQKIDGERSDVDDLPPIEPKIDGESIDGLPKNKFGASDADDLPNYSNIEVEDDRSTAILESNVRNRDAPSQIDHHERHERESVDFIQYHRKITSNYLVTDEFIGPTFKTEVKKDIAILFKQNSDLKKSVKEIKSLLLQRNVRGNSPSSQYSTSDEEIKFALLPQFKLKKFHQVLTMETDINENPYYQKQLIKKLTTFGGKTIKDCVINIFNGLFTNKLKTKMCWIGTPDKKEFRVFTGIRNVFRQAVKTRIRKCSLADIDAEIKLRFNQAQKDYDREKAKKRR